MKPARVLLLLLALAAAFVGGLGYGRWYGPRAGVKITATSKGYHCPMHRNYHSDKPGECPICGMKLVPDDGGPAPATAATGAPASESTEAMPPGTVHVSAEKQQLIGVKFGTVTAGSENHTFRSIGRVTMDETRFTKVQTRIDGWIDQVFVDFTGKLVEKGQPLFTMYSPEMLASQREYLLALRSREIMQSSPLASSRPQGDSLVAAARKRLELFSLSEAQIENITRTGQPLTNITVYAPMSGYVMMRNAFPKQRVTPETDLYTIVDLSRVWIMADVFENEASMIRIGMSARMKSPSGAVPAFNGQVSYIQPQVDPTTRTLKVRIEAANPAMALKPDMFVDVEFQVATAARMTVASEAVLDTGLRKTVFVDRGNGYLEPRQVETGERIGDRVEVLKGVSLGDRVVTSGNFLIDSESQLKAGGEGRR
jgi:RND family efflux transporter MFP subunit